MSAEIRVEESAVSAVRMGRLTPAGGGMMVTPSASLADRARLQRALDGECCGCEALSVRVCDAEERQRAAELEAEDLGRRLRRARHPLLSRLLALMRGGR